MAGKGRPPHLYRYFSTRLMHSTWPSVSRLTQALSGRRRTMSNDRGASATTQSDLL
ncbi:hypothetical protein TrVFT333_011101 [Trichoderma virens FT-333]|nr:hypothetical protein TrVFT333_011101 [Trichoderma virens FT-333]